MTSLLSLIVICWLCLGVHGQARGSPTYKGGCVCAKDEDFNYMNFLRRRSQARIDVEKQPVFAWWKAINNKLGAFAFARALGVNAPGVFGCHYIMPYENSKALGATDQQMGDEFKRKHKKLFDSLVELRNKHPTGFVIKPANGFSSNGVYIITNSSVKAVHDLHLGKHSVNSLAGVAASVLKTASESESGKEWQVEELVKSRIPNVLEDYKFLMFGGNIAAIDYIQRASSNDCFLTTDTTLRIRYDNGKGLGGCIGRPDGGGCSRLYSDAQVEGEKHDWNSCTARHMQNTVIGMANRPNADPKAKKLWKDTVDAVRKLGNAVGVQMRIDMMISSKGPYIGEFTPFHRNGIKDCAVDPTTSPPDPCYMGKQWKKFGWEHEMLDHIGDLKPNATIPKINGEDFIDIFVRNSGLTSWKAKCLATGMKKEHFYVV